MLPRNDNRNIRMVSSPSVPPPEALYDFPPERKLERGYVRMFPRNEKTRTRVHSPKPPFHETALLLPLECLLHLGTADPPLTILAENITKYFLGTFSFVIILVILTKLIPPEYSLCNVAATGVSLLQENKPRNLLCQVILLYFLQIKRRQNIFFAKRFL